jgi:hypothetical protein
MSGSKFAQDVSIALHVFADRAAMAKLRNTNLGQTLFLVGSGPSLKQMDLAPLRDGIAFMTVNNGFRLFAGQRIPMHAVSDNACYEKFGDEIEHADIGQRFYRSRFRALPAFARNGHPASTVFVPYRKGGVLKRGFQPRAEKGLGNDASVLIFAAQLAYHLGFSTVNVLGCDLDYSTPNAYAYAMTDADRAHEESAEVQSRRGAMVNANAEFAEVRRHFEADGRKLINCGVGGKLDALPRMSFEQAIAAAR